MTLNEIERGQLCQSTIESLYEATGGLKHFPGLLKKIIQERAWERRVNKGHVIELGSLRELITEKPIRGWGEDPKRVEAVIKDDPVALTLYREAMKGEEGGDKRSKDATTNDNIICGKAEQGTSRAYTLSRLKRDHPELYAEVCDGNLSANAAAIKAGFRKVKTPAEHLKHWWGKASDEEREAFLDYVSTEEHNGADSINQA